MNRHDKYPYSVPIIKFGSREARDLMLYWRYTLGDLQSGPKSKLPELASAVARVRDGLRTLQDGRKLPGYPVAQDEIAFYLEMRNVRAEWKAVGDATPTDPNTTKALAWLDRISKQLPTEDGGFQLGAAILTPDDPSLLAAFEGIAELLGVGDSKAPPTTPVRNVEQDPFKDWKRAFRLNLEAVCRSGRAFLLVSDDPFSEVASSFFNGFNDALRQLEILVGSPDELRTLDYDWQTPVAVLLDRLRTIERHEKRAVAFHPDRVIYPERVAEFESLRDLLPVETSEPKPWIGQLQPPEPVRKSLGPGLSIDGDAISSEEPDPALRPRQELILEVFDRHGPGPYRAKRVAGLAQLAPDPRLRADLSELKKLGYLSHDGSGYRRTPKPYRCP